VNETKHDNPEDLTINTLDNAIYMNMKNDVSFIMGCDLNLYEHQSTVCPNIPLRNLFYISRVIEGMIVANTLYSPKVVKIPNPQFIVFYNGLQKQPEKKILKLSDAFEKETDSPALELEVIMLNINTGKNKELMEQCQTLQEYVIYVETVRKYMKIMDIHMAVDRAVDECIKNDILFKFLKKNRAEAIQMSIFEYDEEREMRLIRADMRELEREEGREEGRIALEVEQVRKKLKKKKIVSEIVDMLELEEEKILHIIEALKFYPNKSDKEIAIQLLFQ
jgi:Uncharacterized conserved protein